VRRQTKYIALVALLAVCACAKNIQPRVTGPTPTRQQTFFAHYKTSLDLANFTYETTFRAIGDAARAGLLKPADVEELNVIGRIVQAAGQKATAALADYLKVTDPGASDEAKVQAALSAIEKAVADVVAAAKGKGVKL
jgi:hypothetical protein